MNVSSTASKHRPSTRRRRWLWITFALLLFVAVISVLSFTEDTVDVARKKVPPAAPTVSTETVKSSTETIEISGFSEIRPRWSAELKAAVSGRIFKVMDRSLAGERVAAGETLILIENSRYAAELAEAELALKRAKLALWQARNANLVARKDFERSGKSAPNDLALKLPQLNIAQSALASAQARVTAATRQLNDATVLAPFAGFVTKRFVSPGQSVNVGDRLVKLADNTTYELAVELSRKNWNLLQKPLSGLTARVSDDSGKIVTHARVRQGGGFLDEATRQYKVFLQISGRRAERVLSGDFVRVTLPGITLKRALNIPASALTQEGHVWHVDAGGHLRRMTPEVLFRRQDRVVIAAPGGGNIWRIVITPLASFLPGQRVRTSTGGS